MSSTTLNPSEISELIKNRIEQFKLGAEARNEGTIISVSDGMGASKIVQREIDPAAHKALLDQLATEI